jgi:hypothetical protein
MVRSESADEPWNQEPVNHERGGQAALYTGANSMQRGLSIIVAD